MTYLEDISPALAPNVEHMKAHLTFLFADAREYDDGLIEIAVGMPNDNGLLYKFWQANLFAMDKMDEAVSFAGEKNAAGFNVFVGAALRDPDTAQHTRSKETDHYASTAMYVDLDDEEAANNAARLTSGLKPSFVVCTGRHPHRRMQLWWKLVEPITDTQRHRQIAGGLADTLGGDRAVVNSDRIMRLAGSIAWPTKTGRVPELTFVMALPSGAGMPCHADDLAARYPAVNKVFTIDPSEDAIERVAVKNSLGLDTGRIDDGRERLMYRTVMAVFVEYVGTHGCEPSAQEIFDIAWPQYQKSVVTHPEGKAPRTEKEMAIKCAYILRRFAEGRLPGLPTLEAVVSSYKGRKPSTTQEAPPRPEPESTVKPGGKIEVMSVADLRALPPPQWLIENHMFEDGWGYIWGAPGCGKSFMALDMALHVSYGAPQWHYGKKITAAGDVLYIVQEGVRGFARRIDAWKAWHKAGADTDRLWLIRQRLNFLAASDVQALVETVKAQGRDFKLIVLDTFSRVIPGADENSQEDMSLFVEACERVREITAATLVGVHHGNKAGEQERGSSVLRGAADFVFKLEKEQASQRVTMTCTKLKDEEDGWSSDYDLVKTDFAIPGQIMGGSSLVVVEGAPVESPDTPMLKAVIVHLMQEGSQNKQSVRDYMIQRFGVTDHVARKVLDSWLDAQKSVLVDGEQWTLDTEKGLRREVMLRCSKTRL